MKLIGEVKEIIPRKKVKGQIVDYSHALMDVAGSWKKGFTGKKIPVVVVDTGGSPKHPDLKKNTKGGKSFVPGMWGCYQWADYNGHSTHCAGIIGAADNKIGVVGVAKDCHLWYAKVIEPNTWQCGAVAKGILWAVKHIIKEYGYSGVLSISLGGAGYDKSTHAAIRKAVKEKFIVVAAAGNDGGQLSYPAKLKEVISVGAVDKDKVRAGWSNYGESLDLVAPGVEVHSTYLKKGYCKLSGTSMACPAVSGIAALAKEKHGDWFGYEEFRELLKEGCLDLGNEGRDPKHGWGLVQSPRIATLNGRDYEVVI